MELYKKIDITKTLEKSREENTHLQSRLLFQLYKILNSIENFKYDILDGNLIIWEKIYKINNLVLEIENLYYMCII